jgi:hypothetical protein
VLNLLNDSHSGARLLVEDDGFDSLVLNEATDFLLDFVVTAVNYEDLPLS